ncbi:unnamed protein product [Phytophthora fragariaefolia]|uniref:Unnamed protein product n=1 Tax=Phytophthora fragariaefolia TaxID=1490495 RepID=A0A9W6XMH2_9STRA|nr:unnamed protein product [Phytophthora fragariaefolia]
MMLLQFPPRQTSAFADLVTLNRQQYPYKICHLSRSEGQCTVVLVASASRTTDGQTVGDHDGCKMWHGEMRAEVTGRAWTDRDQNEVTVTPSSELTGSHGG